MRLRRRGCSTLSDRYRCWLSQTLYGTFVENTAAHWQPPPVKTSSSAARPRFVAASEAAACEAASAERKKQEGRKGRSRG